MEKYVIVPQRDLDALEKGRLLLWELFEELCEKNNDIYGISRILFGTDAMWELSHKKYPESQPPEVY